MLEKVIIFLIYSDAPILFISEKDDTPHHGNISIENWGSVW